MGRMDNAHRRAGITQIQAGKQRPSTGRERGRNGAQTDEIVGEPFRRDVPFFLPSFPESAEHVPAVQVHPETLGGEIAVVERIQADVRKGGMPAVLEHPVEITSFIARCGHERREVGG